LNQAGHIIDRIPLVPVVQIVLPADGQHATFRANTNIFIAFGNQCRTDLYRSFRPFLFIFSVFFRVFPWLIRLIWAALPGSSEVGDIGYRYRLIPSCHL
ncbi:hypothetical protein CF392_16375, partial [Tamilnaduibacter salinus]